MLIGSDGKRSFRSVRRGDVAAIIIVFVIIAFVCYVAIEFPDKSQFKNTGLKPGPDWDCNSTRASFCIKRPPKDLEKSPPK
jgi:hypothetical protein